MTRRDASLPAVFVLLVVLTAWTAVTVPAASDGARGGGAVVDVDDDQAERFVLYQELTTYAPSVAGAGSPSGEVSREHEPDYRVHSWRCPVCGQTKRSLGAQSGNPREEAANNLRSHLRNSAADGHGRKGELPAAVSEGTIQRSVHVGAPPE